MNNQLFLVDYIVFMQDTLSLLKDKQAQGVKIIALSDLAYEWLVKEGVTCKNFHDYEYPGIYDSIMSLAQEYGCSWYKQANSHKDFTEFNGISTGFLVERTMIYYFMDTLKTMSVIEAVVAKEKPGKIIIFDGQKDKARFDADIPTVKRIVNFLAKGIEIELIDVNCKHTAKTGPSLWLKGFARETLSLFNFIFNTIKRFSHTGSPRNIKKIVFYEGFHHVQAIFIALKAYKGIQVVHLQDKFSPKTFTDIVKSNAIIEDLRRYEVKENKHVFSADINKIEEALKSYFIFKDKNVFPVVWDRIKYMLQEHIPNIVVRDVLCLENYITKSSPDVVVTENDSVYKERLITVISKKHNTKTAVIQHGLSIGGSSGLNKDFFCADFYPVTADKFLAWGEFTKQWLEKKGAAPGSVILTGSSRFDNYYNNSNNGINELKSKVNPKGKSIVLVALSEFSGRHYIPKYHYSLYDGKRHLKEILKVAKNNNNMLFIVRPHSSDSFTLGLLNDVVRSEQVKNVMIDRSTDLYSLLKIADICVGLYSTVLAEAMVCGVPVVTMNFDNRPEVVPYSEYNLSEKVNSAQELENILKKLLNGSTAFRNDLKERVKNNIHVINYKHDGKATERIAECLANI